MHLAHKHKIGGLVLFSAFTSIKCVVRSLVGSLGEALVKQRFDNLAKIVAVDCPILLIHGDEDDLVPIGHSRSLQGTSCSPQQLQASVRVCTWCEA